ncbi:UNVERIFIED_CONTAM: hypothetical protein Sindi_0197700, partial [Sesamum indicum]
KTLPSGRRRSLRQAAAATWRLIDEESEEVGVKEGEGFSLEEERGFKSSPGEEEERVLQSSVDWG